MSEGLVVGLLSFACLPIIYVVFTRVLPFLLAGMSSMAPEPKEERKLKRHPDPIPEVVYGEVVEDDWRYNVRQLEDGNNKAFNEFWDKVERGERIVVE